MKPAALLLALLLTACAGLSGESIDSSDGLAREFNPLSTNWEARPVRLAEDRYRIELVEKRWHNGGDGEAVLLFRRQAEALAHAGGYSRYVIARYEEALDSNWLVQRSARGEVLLLR